jgi:hypothetical protein
LSNDYGLIPSLQIRLQILEFGKPIIPSHKLSRGEDAESVLSRYSQRSVLRRPVGKQYSVIVRLHLRQLDIMTDSNVSNVVEARRLGHLLEGIFAILDLGMVWRNAKSNKTIRHGKLLVHVHHRIWQLLHQPMGGIEAGRAGADNGEPERLLRRRCAVRIAG